MSNQQHKESVNIKSHRFLQDKSLVFMLEFCVTSALINHMFLLAGLLHLAALLIAFKAVLRDKKYGCDMKLSLLFALMITLAGPFGAFCSALTLFFYSRYSRVSMNFMDWFSALYPEEETEENLQVYDRILLGLENTGTHQQVEPFQDIIANGTAAQKQAAIIKMTRYFTPAYAPLLRQALDDAENAVRVHAATALAKLDRDYLQNYLRLEKTWTNDPKENAITRELAALCDNYASSGIAEPASEQAYRRKAIGYYEKLESGADVSLTLARLYRQTGQLEKSRSCLEDQLHSSTMHSPELMESYLETLYQMENFKHMREFANRNAATLQSTMPQLLEHRLRPAQYQTA
jgi:hypothetical protein